jgi:hypothetical protein
MLYVWIGDIAPDVDSEYVRRLELEVETTIGHAVHPRPVKCWAARAFRCSDEPQQTPSVMTIHVISAGPIPATDVDRLQQLLHEIALRFITDCNSGQHGLAVMVVGYSRDPLSYQYLTTDDTP